MASPCKAEGSEPAKARAMITPVLKPFSSEQGASTRRSRSDSFGTSDKTQKRVNKRPRVHDGPSQRSRDPTDCLCAAFSSDPHAHGSSCVSSDSVEDCNYSSEDLRTRIALSEEVLLLNVELSPLELSETVCSTPSSANAISELRVSWPSPTFDDEVGKDEAGATGAPQSTTIANAPHVLLGTPMSSSRGLNSGRRLQNATSYTVAASDGAEGADKYRCITPTHKATPRPPVQCDMVALHRIAQRTQAGTRAGAGGGIDEPMHADVAEAQADGGGVFVTVDGVVLPPSPAAVRGVPMLALPPAAGGDWEPFEASATLMPPPSGGVAATMSRNHRADQEALRVRIEAQHDGLSLLGLK